jgi:hypothetical protein
MVKVMEKNSINIGKEPIVIFPLKKWEEIEQTIEDLKEATRFNIALEESRGKRLFSLGEIAKKYKLK